MEKQYTVFQGARSVSPLRCKMEITNEYLNDIKERVTEIEGMISFVEEEATKALPDWFFIWGYPCVNIRDYKPYITDFAEFVKHGRIRIHYLKGGTNNFQMFMPVDFLMEGGIERELERASKLMSALNPDTVDITVGRLHQMYPDEFKPFFPKCEEPVIVGVEAEPILAEFTEVEEEEEVVKIETGGVTMSGIIEEEIEEDVVKLEPNPARDPH